MKFELKVNTKSQTYRVIIEEKDLNTLEHRATAMFEKEFGISGFRHTPEYPISNGDCYVIIPNKNIEYVEIREIKDE